MDPENENGQTTSESPADTNDSKNEASSTSINSEQGSSPEAPTSVLDAITQELGAGDEEEQGDKTTPAEEGEQGAADDRAKEKKDEQAEDKTGGEDEDLYEPLPDDVKEKTRERFTKLVDSHKEITSRLETAETDLNDFREVINYSGATPEEFNQLVEYSHRVKSGDLEGALQLLDTQRAQLAQFLGKPVAGVDQLTEFPDLQQQVAEYKITDEAALEIAAARRREAMSRQQQKNAAQQENAARGQQQQVAVAQQEITALANTWSANDIDYAQKHDLLMEKAKEISVNYPPRLWKQALTDYYQAMQVPPGAAPVSKRTPQPLRSQQGGGGQQVPQNMLQAVEQGLGD